MSSETRKYQLKARAESQRETRAAIARAAAELHEQLGVARTTVTEIARRAGVSRLTVYNHFPDLDSLLPACAAHFEDQHPMPDLDEALAVTDPAERVTATLTLLYGWYRETATLWRNLLGDRAAVPELDAFLTQGLDAQLAALGAELARTVPEDSVGRRALLRLALDFWTWARMDEQGLDDRAAARVLAHAATSA